MRLYVIANWMQGSELSGGDRILIELSRQLSKQMEVVLLVSEEGWAICRREGLEGVEHRLWASDYFNRFGYPVSYLYRTINSLAKSARLKINAGDIIYSSSDFWPDSIPAFVLKMRYNMTWVAGFYLFAAKPWLAASPYKGRRFFIGFFYWLTQIPVHWLVRQKADLVFVTSQPDVKNFVTSRRPEDKVVVVQGGVDLRPASAYLSSGRSLAPDQRKFDACFVGRFHYQKGVIELVKIWRLICDKKPSAKLVMIGAGPMDDEVKTEITRLKLEPNIVLTGFRNGEEKYNIFRQSRIVVHPATYDSGGMAAIEAMAWGLPGVSFDLEALKTYYPKGMLKTACFDLDGFAANIRLLLDDPVIYDRLKAEAIELSKEWSWDKKAALIFEKLTRRS